MDNIPSEPPPLSDTCLTSLEARVLGCLIEKELATPDYYPLTFAGLLAACNQKSNRDPVMSLESKAVERVLDSLRSNHKLVMLVREAGGRVPKYRHHADDHFGMNHVESAVLAELLVRGPQTEAELKTRVPRMIPTLSDQAVANALDSLAELHGKSLVVKLPKAHGRRESRYAHQLCGPVLNEEETTLVIEAPPAPEEGRIQALETEILQLKDQLADLQQQFHDFKRAFE